MYHSNNGCLNFHFYKMFFFFQGTTPEEFIKKPTNGESPYTKFRQRMQEKIGAPKIDNVQIISVQRTTVDGVEYTDVRYAAYKSPYFQGSQLDGIVNQYRNEVSS